MSVLDYQHKNNMDLINENQFNPLRNNENLKLRHWYPRH